MLLSSTGRRCPCAELQGISFQDLREDFRIPTPAKRDPLWMRDRPIENAEFAHVHVHVGPVDAAFTVMGTERDAAFSSPDRGRRAESNLKALSRMAAITVEVFDTEITSIRNESGFSSSLFQNFLNRHAVFSVCWR